MKYIKHFLMLALAVVFFTACSEDPIVVAKQTNATINLLNPSESVDITSFEGAIITFTELNTKTTTSKRIDNNVVELTLNQGSYEVSINGGVKYSLNGEEQEGNIGAFVSELNFIEDEQTEDVQLSLKSFSKDFIIEEIFFTGSLAPDGSSYGGDKYFKLYNNTDEVLYADGLLLVQSRFLTVDKQDYSPNVMPEAYTVGSMVQLPGSGTEYPIEAGKSLIVAMDGINHVELNANSIDLSTANFEIFNDGFGDVDSPTVTNATNLVENIFPHGRGFDGYAIARFPEGVTADSYLADATNKYDYDWTLVFGTFSFDESATSFKLPNEWILDAVNLSVESEFQWIVTDPSLDSSYTYCGKVDRDDTRFGKSVRRKVLQEVDGVRLLQDTNNSAVDFIPEASLSLK
ncbi:DUF4876 domain-containing protein [Tenacibaculum sp. M341]|uniref:DUF4876 domain-containing protein n=1 Tax=Tenacibaculum sp. M341 TaxID=2530339 RepID=UPI00104E3190|nr:DUF4876 domain-containing protein [Tenacibaculum sp. M341]TCI94319.1 DUF4876 domain-containing protein [Tenacibaculum sp. M341]